MIKRSASIFRILITFVFLSGLLAPFTTFDVGAQEKPSSEPTTGVLQVVLQSADTGQRLAGACWDVTDVNGVTFPYCDFDADGITSFELTPGLATVKQTGGPEGYRANANGTKTVTAGQLTVLTLSVAAIPAPVQTAEEPAEPAEEPKVETTEEVAEDVAEEATDEPAEDVTEEVTEDVSEDVTEEVGDEPAEDVTEEVTEDVAEDVTDEVAEETSEESAVEESIGSDEESTLDSLSEENSALVSGFSTFDLANDSDLFTITCNYNNDTGLSSFTFSLVQEVPNLPGNPTITYQPYNLLMVPLTPIVHNTYTSSFPNQAWRVLEVSFVRPDGVTGTASADCNTTKVQPSITTQPITGTNTVIPQMGAVTVGTALKDSATMTGQTINASGTATYNLYKNGDCSGTPIYTQTVVVTNGVIPNSPNPGYMPPATPAGQGLYNWRVTYSGDDLNLPVTSQCGLESLVYGKSQSAITTTMRIGGTNTVVGQNGNIFVDQTITDQGTLANVTANAGGSIQFRLYAGDCSGQVLFEQTVPVVNGAAVRTNSAGPLPVGTYNWVAVYSGDDLNETATSPCGAETFNVIKRNPSVSTQPRSSTGAAINDGANVNPGTQIRDTASFGTGNNAPTSDASGTVTYYLWAGSGCNIADAIWSETVTVANGVIPDSSLVSISGGNPFNTIGTYNFQAIYSGDAKNNGNSSPCGSETVNVVKASPTITTVMKRGSDITIPQNAVISLPANVYDTATLSGAIAPTGTVTYFLYKGLLCDSSTLIETIGPLPLNPNGTLPNATPAVTITEGGTYNWVASYSGDGNNNGATGTCGHEQFHAGTGTGSIATDPRVSPGTTQPSNNGNALADGAEIPALRWVADRSNLTGFFPGRTGTITYNLYYHGSSEAGGCANGGALVHTSTRNVTTNNPQALSTWYQATQPGRYEWQAVYSGDSNNAGATSPCGAETFYVGKATTTTATVMKAEGGATIADNSSINVPFKMYDTAQVTGTVAPLTGTIEYRLYRSTGCNDTPTVYGPYTIVGGVIPDLPVLVELTDPIVYNWRAFYSGDNLHNASSSNCGGETVYGRAQPTLSTGPRYGTTANGNSHGPVALDQVIPLGSYVSDTSTLSNASNFKQSIDGENNATVTYRLYAGETCTGTPVHTSGPTPLTSNTANNLPASSSFQLNFSGVYNWQATYSGNRTNTSAVSPCGSERFIVAAGNPVLTTEMRHGESSGSQGSSLTQGSLQQLPRWVSDRSTIVGLPHGTTGTLTYELFLASDPQNPCGGTPVHTSVHTNVTNLTSLPNSSSFRATTFGVYNWVVTFQPSGQGSAPVVSGCGEETFIGVENLPRTIDIACTYFPESGTSTFVITVAKINTSAPDYHPNPNGLTVVVSPLSVNNAPVVPVITYHNYNSSIGPNNPNFVQQPWRSVSVAVTWPDGITGSANAGCNNTKLSPTFGTKMLDDQGGEIVNDTLLQVGDKIGDSIVNFTGATVDYSGHFEYRLYNNTDCSGEPIWSEIQAITAQDRLPKSSLYTIGAGGDYNWVVVYSGDTFNNSYTSGCGEEFFRGGQYETEITTAVKVGDTVIADDGTVAVGAIVRDTATLSGQTATAGGTVTYALYKTADCSDTPLVFPAVTVTNGVIPDSPTVTAEAGLTYNWVVTYSGDVSNAASVSECGLETFLTPKLRIEKTNDTGAAAVYPGSTIAFKIVLTNNGPGIALGSSISDVLPTNAGLNWTVDGQGSSPNCTISAGSLNCAPRDLAAGESITARITSPTTAATCTEVLNIASYSSINAGDGTSNQAKVDVLCTDIKVQKVATSSTVLPGGLVEFTVTVTNIGDNNATDVKIKDYQLPAGDWTVTAGTGVTCPAGLQSGSFECSVTGDLEPDGSRWVKISRNAGATECATLNNKAEVTASNEWTTPESVLLNNKAEASVEVLCTTLSLVKTPDNGFIFPGTEASPSSAEFTIVVKNTGSNSAVDVRVVDTLPAGEWTVTSSQGACDSPATGSSTCEIGTMTAGQEVTITVKRDVTVADCGELPNSATVSSGNVPTDVTDDGKITVKCADVTVSKTPDALVDGQPAGHILPGQIATFTVTIKNLGQYPAIGATIRDYNLPSGTWTVTAGNGVSCPAGLAQGSITCDVVGELAVNEERSITLSRVTTTADCGTLNNDAEVSALNEYPTDLAQGNNKDSGSIVVMCGEVGLTKTATNAAIYPGELAEFTIVVTSYGPFAAQDVVIKDIVLPAGTWNINADAGVTCPATASAPFECTLAEPLAKDDTVTITVSKLTTVQDCGELNNKAEVTISNERTTGLLHPNFDEDTIEVLCTDITVDKTPDDGTVYPGGNLVFQIVVSNVGENIAKGVVLKDALPAGDWTITSNPAGYASGIVTGNLNVPIGDLAVDGSVTFTLTRQATVEDCGVMPNTANVEATNEWPNATAPNSDSGQIEVLCTDVAVFKTPDNATVYPGGSLQFVIMVANMGENIAKDVVLKDTLPPGEWTITSLPPNLASGVVSGNLEVVIGDLPAGQNGGVMFTLTRTATVDDCGRMPNIANVEASNEWPTATWPNTDDALITVLCTEIELEKKPDNGTIYPGENAVFTIEVFNRGDVDARDVVIVDQLPAGQWTVTGVSPMHYQIDLNGKLTADLGIIRVGDSVKITLSRPTSTADCGPIRNEASASASNEVPEHEGSLPNDDDALITVLCTTVELEKDPDDAQILPGDTAEFTIKVTNTGTNIGKNVEITDQLPTGTWTIVTNPTSVSTNVDANNKLTATISEIAVGGEITITLTRTVTVEDCGPLPNSASVKITNEWPGNEADNTDDALITVKCSEVEIDKTPDNHTINAGEDAIFTIVARNNGPYEATGVVLKDTLPVGSWTVTVTDAPQGVTVDCGQNPKVGSFECSLSAPLAKDATVTLTVSRPTTDADCITLLNSAEVASTNEVPNATANNTDTGDITVNCADLWVEKFATGGANAINATDDISFTIVVHNDGDGVATDVRLIDSLPTGIEWDFTADRTGCSIDDTTTPGVQTLSCAFGNMAANTSITIEVFGVTDPTDCGVIENVVTITAANVTSGQQPDGQDDPLSATATITVNCPDIDIVKSAVTSPVSAGDELGFTITVTNTGAGVAYDVRLTDTLPLGITGWSVSGADAEACDITAGVLECDFGDLAALTGSATVTITGLTSNAVCGEVLNTATVSALNFLTDGDVPTNEVSDSDVVMVDCPDVVITKDAESAEIFPGANATFIITVTNLGPGNAKGVKVTDTLPVGEWLVIPDAGLTCDTVEGIAEGTFECTITADLAPEGTRQITVTRPATAEDCGDLQNDVSVSATNEAPEKVDEGNSDSATILVKCSEVEIDKTPDDHEIEAGELALFTIVTKNNGPHPATDVVIWDELPSGEWTIAVTQAPDGVTVTCDTVDGKAIGRFECELDKPLDVDATVTITVGRLTTDADAPDRLVNWSHVSSSNEIDNADENNHDPGDIRVKVADLWVEKFATDDVDEINAGEGISFTIVVHNDGEGTAKNAVLTDELPAGIEWDFTASREECAIEDGVLNCAFGDLEPGGSITIVVFGETDGSDCGEQLNLVTVGASNVTGDKTDEATILVKCSEVEIDKTPDDAEIDAGDVALFTIVTKNNGPHPAKDVVIWDELPDTFEWTVAVIDAPEGVNVTCDTVNGIAVETFRCELDADLAVGATVTITVSRLTTDADAPDRLVNWSHVSSSNEIDNADENNHDPGDIRVKVADLWGSKSATDGADEINAGDRISFTIVVHNDGEGIARNVTVTDELPAGFDWDFVADREGCAIEGGVLECAFNDLAPGASITIEVFSATDGADCGEVWNGVTIGASNVTGDKTDDATILVKCSEVEIDKTPDDAEIEVGEVAKFTIVTKNNGPHPAKDVVIWDELPDTREWMVTVIDAPEGVNVTCDTVNGIAVETFRCELDADLAVGATVTITVSRVTTMSDANVKLVNWSHVSSSNEIDNADENNHDPGDITVKPVDGELKLLKIFCKTDKARAPLFEVVKAGGFTLNDDCWRGANVSFTISGGNLESPVTISTNRDGEFGLTLRAGTYTITEVATGASTTVTVTAKTTTYVKVTNYTTKKPGPDPDPDPTPKPETPIEQMPDTGAGFVNDSMTIIYLPLLAMLLMAIGAVTLNNAKRGRRS